MIYCNNKCFNCPNLVLVTSATTSGGFTTLTLPNINLCNNTKICFIIPSTISLPATPTPIKVSINGTTFLWLSKHGNYVYTDQVKARTVYVVRMKTDSKVALNERCNLRCSNVTLPVIPVPTVVSVSDIQVGDKK